MAQPPSKSIPHANQNSPRDSPVPVTTEVNGTHVSRGYYPGAVSSRQIPGHTPERVTNPAFFIQPTKFTAFLLLQRARKERKEQRIEERQKVRERKRMEERKNEEKNVKKGKRKYGRSETKHEKAQRKRKKFIIFLFLHSIRSEHLQEGFPLHLFVCVFQIFY